MDRRQFLSTAFLVPAACALGPLPAAAATQGSTRLEFAGHSSVGAFAFGLEVTVRPARDIRKRDPARRRPARGLARSAPAPTAGLPQTSRRTIRSSCSGLRPRMSAAASHSVMTRTMAPSSPSQLRWTERARRRLISVGA